MLSVQALLSVQPVSGVLSLIQHKRYLACDESVSCMVHMGDTGCCCSSCLLVVWFNLNIPDPEN